MNCFRWMTGSCAGFPYASQVPTLDEVSIRALNLQIPKAEQNQVLALRFVPLDKESTGLTACADASSASSPDMSSQPDFVMLLRTNLESRLLSTTLV